MSRPIGLTGTNGLYGSDEWWANIKSGKIPTECIDGKIVKIVEDGQDKSGVPNTVVIRCNDGVERKSPIYLLNNNDAAQFVSGRRLRIVNALEVLKSKEFSLRSDGYHPVTLEIFIE